MKSTQPVSNRERVFLVGVGVKRASRVPGIEAGEAERASLLELDELARSAGAEVTGSSLQMRDAIDPATLVGRGKLEEIKIDAEMRKARALIFDRNLTPVQQRNIEAVTDCRVVDRTQLILDIFARHARSREGQMQVELAQLNYLMPRLTGKGTELSRLGGGIGTRGPGEQKLETDRRRIRDRVRKIKEDIERVRRQRGVRRQAREAVPLGTVALVGYTNAGKSTLFNTLTDARVLSSARMFATLDPTIRSVELPSNRKALLSDTVGFIRELPPGLITAFRATLEEVQESAVILHVSDVSNPHHPEQDAEVEKILKELGVEGRPRIHVFNKIDRIPMEERGQFRSSNGNVFVSAQERIGIDALLARIDQLLPVDPTTRMELAIPIADGRTLALVHARGRVFSTRATETCLLVDAEVPESLARRLTAFRAKENGTPPRESS